MFDAQRFISACDAAILGGQGSAAIRSLLAAAIADPAAIIAALGEPTRAGVEILHRSPHLTVLNLSWPPCFSQTAHDHQMWAEIGVYSGREDNVFWRRCPPDARWPIEVVGAASLLRGDSHSMKDDIIHSITNPLDKLTAALHVYGGDILAVARHEWDGETLQEEPFHNKRGERACEIYNSRINISLPDAVRQVPSLEANRGVTVPAETQVQPARARCAVESSVNNAEARDEAEKIEE